MKFLKSIFFHIYNTYYKDGDYTNDIPHFTAFGWVGTSMGAWLAVMMALVNYLLTKSRPSFELVVLVMVGSLALLYPLLLYQRRYARIYEQIKGSNMDTPSMKVVAWVIVVGGFLSISLYAYIFNQPNGD